MSNSSVFPLEIQELRRPGSAIRIDVRCFTSIKDIKAQLQKDNKYPLSRMQLYHSVGSKCLSNETTLHDLNITTAGGVLLLAYVFSSNPQFMLVPAKDMQVDEQCEEMIHQVRVGLRSGHLPAKTDMLDCTGGVYFMKGAANTPAAVFKPSDEEQGMPNNPKGYAGNGDYGLRPFFKPGEGYIRETASYILDFQNFCNVPPTITAHCEHDSFHYPRNQTGQKNMFPKLGSLQKFVPSGDTFEDIGHSLVGVLELQKIALLDMRLLNCDRNASNMLAIRKPAGMTSSAHSSAKRKNDAPRKYSRTSSLGTASDGAYDEDAEIDLDDFLDPAPAPGQSRYSDTYALVPIDHGYCLPSHLRIDELDWAWFHCPHVAVEVQPEIRDYVNALDIDSLLAELTRQLPISEDCLFLLRTAHAVIKEGIAAGLTLRDIAAIIARTDEDVPSPLENAIAAAEDNAQRTIEMRAGAGRRNTTSPSFLKSMQESSTFGIASIVATAAGGAILHPSERLTNSPRGDELSSPGPVIVKQKSVGSPRSGGTRSPPQRIGAIQRVSSGSPSATSPSDAGGNESDGYSIGSGAGHSSRNRSVVPGAATAKRVRSKSDEADDDVFPEVASFGSPIARLPIAAATPGSAGVSGLVRPFPLRTTPPERQRRVVSSELNLEAIGQCSPPPVLTSGANSARGGAERGSSYSLSSSSRSPIPQHTEHFAGKLGGPGSNKVNIGYLSSENIQRLQSSPAMAAPRFPEFLFRDPPRPLSGSVGPDATLRSASPEGGDFGDYFMKDLSVPVSSAVGGAAEQLRLELPGTGLRSGSAAPSPHRSGSNSAFNVHPGSKDRIASADSSDKLQTHAVPPIITSSGSAKHLQTGNFGSSQSVGASSNSSGSVSSLLVRPRPGDALLTLQSFDEDYKRQRTRGTVAPQARAADPTTAPVTVPVSAPIVQARESSGLPRTLASSPAEFGRKAAAPGMSVALFASDSDLMSHSTGTSYESSWSGESPKMSPKVPIRDRKGIPAGNDFCETACGGQKNPLYHGEKIAVPIRDSFRSSSHHRAAAGKGTAEAVVSDGAVGLAEDCAVHLTIPLNDDDNARCRKERDCSSVELAGTDTDGEEPPSPPLRHPASIINSAVKTSRMPTEPPKSSKPTGMDEPSGRSPGPAPYKLSRVTSFAAFESPPLYDLPKSERQVTRLRQERRKVIATTAEFQELRLAFSREFVRSMIRNNKTAAF